MTSDDLIDRKELATGVARRAIDRLMDFAEAKIKERWAKHKNKTSSAFVDYMEAQANRCGLVRTLIYDKQSARLSDIYVPLRCRIFAEAGRSQTTRDISSPEFVDFFLKERNQKSHRKTFAGFISGPAGAGKSFFMRNLYLELVATANYKVPIFIEARELNECLPLDFADIVAEAFQIVGVTISKEQALDGLASGIFIILIDGFDELRISRERHYIKELDRAAECYKSCPILISGRPSEFSDSAQFENCEVLPLTPEQSVELIQKLDFNETTKRGFIKLVRTELHKTHEDFLELPLLCVVMLLTYSDSGKISKQRHDFYEDAFNALWSKHDSKKEPGYEREKFTGLDKQGFLKLVSAFCASSYISETFAMRAAELRAHLEKAKQLTGIAVNEQAFIKDLTISTSLLIAEGNRYRFTHRSFQEYFCAHYILDLGDEDIARAIETISTRYATDSVLSFILSMNPERFEMTWVLPSMGKLRGKLDEAAGSFARYRELIEGRPGGFLAKIRAIYGLAPGSQRIEGALGAWVDMRSPGTDPDEFPKDLGHQRLFFKDIDNLSQLLRGLENKYAVRSELHNALFGRSADPRSTSQSKLRKTRRISVRVQRKG